jgi:ribonucleoside-diphosphate reductase beta chain
MESCAVCSKEPILVENKGRFVLFPIKYPRLWRLYKEAQASNWTTEEINFMQDKEDFQSLDEGQQHFFKMILAFFASSDGIVNENLCANFMEQIQIPEARCAYGFQIHIENVHSQTYSVMLDEYVKDPKERAHLFNAIETVPCVKDKAAWALSHLNNRLCYRERLFAFILMEGLFFSASFCAIHYLKTQSNKMKGLQFSNNLISRDEFGHTMLGIELYNMLQDPLSHAVVHQITTRAVQCEKRYVDESLRVDLIGMNKQLMNQYVQFIADQILFWIHVPRLYNVDNPFTWMLLGLASKNNMFEVR